MVASDRYEQLMQAGCSESHYFFCGMMLICRRQDNSVAGLLHR
jgi:hypothetical protein